MIIKFERIGRNHGVAPLEVQDGLSPDEIAEAVWEYAAKRLASREFNVDIISNKVLIDGGRFGEGFIDA